MPSIPSTIPILVLRGTPAQIGEAHGEALREQVQQHSDAQLSWLLSRSAVSLSEESLWDRWSPQVHCNENASPALMEEMRGIARGANVSFQRVFLLNSLLDVYNIQYPDAASGLVGCSTFAVAGTGHTLTIIGQTYDMPALHQPYPLLLNLYPSNGPRQLVLTFCGMVGCAGMNEAGIGLNINYLSARDTGVGKLHSVIVRQVLGSTNLADAVSSIVGQRRAGGSHYLVADRDGHLVSLETTGKRFAMRSGEHGHICHTNHYLAEELRETEVIREQSIGSSIVRYLTLKRFFKSYQGKISSETLMQLTRDHASYPRSICAHGEATDDPQSNACTVAAMVQSLDDQTMHFVAGCPCQSDYESTRL